MNSEMGFSLRTPASDGACLRNDPRGARHWGAFFAPHTSHEGGAVKGSHEGGAVKGSPLSM